MNARCAGGVVVASTTQSNVRHFRADGSVVRVAGGHGVARLPQDGRSWSSNVIPSSVEWLPNGQVAYAASGDVRVVWPNNGSAMLVSSFFNGFPANTYITRHAYDPRNDTWFLADNSFQNARGVLGRRGLGATALWWRVAGGAASEVVTTSLRSATEFRYNTVSAMVVDPTTGDLLTVDGPRHRVVRVLTNGSAMIVAGVTDTSGSTGDGGAANAALLDNPTSIAVMANGVVAIGNAAGVRVISAAGVISSLVSVYGVNSLSWSAGTSTLHLATVGGVMRWHNGALSAPMGASAAVVRGIGVPGAATWLSSPRQLTLLPGNRLLILTSACRGLYLDLTTNTLSAAIGAGADGSAVSNCTISGEGVPVREANMSGARGLASAPDGSWGFLDGTAFTAPVLRVVGTNGIIATRLRPSGMTLASLAIDGLGGFWSTDTTGNRVVRIWTNGTVTAVGTGTQAVSGYSGSAAAASFGLFGGVTFDPATGDALVADSTPISTYTGPRVIRRINGSTHVISLELGGVSNVPPACCQGNEGQARYATLAQPQSLSMASDGSGRLCFSQVRDRLNGKCMLRPALCHVLAMPRPHRTMRACHLRTVPYMHLCQTYFFTRELRCAQNTGTGTIRGVLGGGGTSLGLSPDGIAGPSTAVEEVTSIVMRPGTPYATFIYADEPNHVVREVYQCTTATLPAISYVGVPSAFVPSSAGGTGGSSGGGGGSSGGGGGGSGGGNNSGGGDSAPGGPSGGAIAGIVIGVLAAVGLAAAGVVLAPKVMAMRSAASPISNGKATPGTGDGIQPIPTHPPASFGFSSGAEATATGTLNPMLAGRQGPSAVAAASV